MLGPVTLALWLLAGAALADSSAPEKSVPAASSNESASQPPATPEAVDLLGTAMNTALPPAERGRAIAQLASLRDDRLLPTLGYLLLDRTREVRAAATEALGSQHTPAAQQALLTAARNAQLGSDVRTLAVTQLARQELPTTPDRLRELANDSSLPASVRRAADDELRSRFPALVPPESASTASAAQTPSGRTVLTLSGILYGGYSLYGIGRLGKNPDAPTLGLLGGAALGGVGGYLLGGDVSRNHALALATATGLGLWSGLGIGYASGIAPGDARLYLLTIGGELLALTATELSWKGLQPTLDPAAASRAGGGAALSFGGALLGATALQLVAQLPEHGQPRFVGVLSGLALGGATGLLLGERLPPPQTALMSTGAFWGLVAGALAGSAALPLDADGRAVEATALLGGALGLTAAGLAWSPRLTAGDVAFVNLGAATGLALGAGLTLLPEPRDDARPAYAVMAAGTMLGAVGSGLLAPSMQLTPGDRLLVGLGATHGFFAGLAVPGLFQESPPGRYHGAGMLLGASLGTVAAAAATQFTERTPRQVSALFLADGLASLGGLGLGLLASSDPGSPAPNAGFLAGGALALGLAPQWRPPLEVSGADPLLVASGALWGGWQGLAIGLGLDGTERQIGGGWLLGMGVGGLSTLALAQTLRLSTAQVAAVDSGGVWGLVLSGTALALSDARSLDNAFVLLAASDAGLAVTTLLISQGVTARQLGIVNLGGLVGGVSVPLFTGLATREGKALGWAALLGSIGGLAGGAVVAGLTEEPAKEKQATPTRHGTGPVFTFEGLTTQPVIGRDGRVDGFAVAARIVQD